MALRENEEVRLGPENCDHGKLVLLGVDARVQGRAVHIVRQAEKRAGD